MKRILKHTALFVSLLLMMSFVSFNKGPINDFKLKNVDGKYVSLCEYKDAKGFIIIFTCNHCPFAKLYPPRFNALNEKYEKLGVPLIAISSTDTIQYEEDTFIEMVKKSGQEKFNFPYLYDAEQKVAKNFSAQKTPHAFVIWKENNEWKVKYNGAIDDNGMKSEQVKTQFVANAVDALLANQKISVTDTKSIGCQIYYRNK
jgi:peroxiredoxin